MKEAFVEMLRGNSNTLGRSPEVVEDVKAQPDRINELFELYFQPDEWVRLRSSNSLRRLWREDIKWVKPFIQRWINEVSPINQPSVNWTFAQLSNECSELFTTEQLATSISIVKGYLKSSEDWIVLNASIEMLSSHAKNNTKLRNWLLPQLEIFSKHTKRSVAGRAKKRHKELADLG